MALGTATVVNRVGHDARPVFMDVVSFAGDGSYPTGGTASFESFVRSAVARGSVDVLAVVPLDCGGYWPVYDYTNDKLKVYKMPRLESTDLRTQFAALLAKLDADGGVTDADYAATLALAAAADPVAVEVSNTTNLSATTFRVLVLSY